MGIEVATKCIVAVALQGLQTLAWERNVVFLIHLLLIPMLSIDNKYLSSVPRSSMSCHRLQRPVVD